MGLTRKKNKGKAIGHSVVSVVVVTRICGSTSVRFDPVVQVGSVVVIFCPLVSNFVSEEASRDEGLERLRGESKGAQQLLFGVWGWPMLCIVFGIKAKSKMKTDLKKIRKKINENHRLFK